MGHANMDSNCKEKVPMQSKLEVACMSVCT